MVVTESYVKNWSARFQKIDDCSNMVGHNVHRRSAGIVSVVGVSFRFANLEGYVATTCVYMRKLAARCSMKAPSDYRLYKFPGPFS